jgi:HlyD family secretion protein
MAAFGRRSAKRRPPGSGAELPPVPGCPLKRPARIALLLILALALVAVLVAISRRKPIPEVEVYTVASGDIDASITTNGKVEPINPAELHSLIESRVVSVHAAEGQQVHKGQLLATLDDAAVQSQLAEAREQLVANQDALRSARAGGKAVELAQLDSDIQKTQVARAEQQHNVAALEKLVTQQAATPQELTDARATLARTESELHRLQTTRTETAREAQVDTSRLAFAVDQSLEQIRDLEEKVRSARVTAPLAGTLYAFPFKRGDFVHPGDLVAAVADLRQVRVRAFVDEPELGGLEPGQTTIISWDALPNRTWTGTTEQIPREVVSRNTRSVGEVLCSVDNSDQRLIPNINVDVRIEERERRGVLVVPRGAVIFNGSHRYVFVVPPGDIGTITRVQRREIRVGSSNASDFEALSGLHSGELVALPGNFALKDGMRIRTAENE